MEVHALNDDLGAKNLCGYHADLFAARDINDFNHRIHDIVTRLGFSDYSFIQLLRSDIYQSALCSLPKEMMSQYFSDSLFTHDMSLNKAQDASECFYRSTLEDYIAQAPFNSGLTNRMNKIRELNQSYGFYDYYHIPTKNKDFPALLSVTRNGIASIEFKYTTREAESSLQILCEAIHTILIKRFLSHCYSAKSLVSVKPKPLRVLSTLANNDMTIEQVARKLNISVMNANQQLKAVRVSLGVKTNYAAIRLTVTSGLINFVDPMN